MESTRAMTRERGSPAESKNCEILLLPTADRRFDTKVKCPNGRASFWVKFPTVRSLTRVKCPGIARGGGWAVLELTGTLCSNLRQQIIMLMYLSVNNKTNTQQPSTKFANEQDNKITVLIKISVNSGKKSAAVRTKIEV